MKSFFRLARSARPFPGTRLKSSESSALHVQTIKSDARPALNFDDARVAFQSKSFGELSLALFVFKLCSFKWLVKNSRNVLGFSRKLFGESLTMWLVKKSFFRHFCAGESREEIRPVVAKQKANGIGSILDFAAEADIHGVADADSAKSEERACDQNMDIILQCIEAAGDSSDGFAAVKMTALGRTSMLERTASIIRDVSTLFARFDTAGNHLINMQQFQQGLQSLGVNLTPEQAQALFDAFDANHNGFIDFLEWSDFLRVEELKEQSLFTTLGSSGSGSGRAPLLPVFTGEEKHSYDLMLSRLDKIASLAAQKKVRLLVDAEQTYFQPAIDHAVLAMQRKYNRQFPIVFNTYQCYLKDSYDRVWFDLQRARREGYFFAAKLVRGAYMLSERKRAMELGYEDPIQPDIDHTHASYHKCLALIMDHIEISNVMVASHNQKTLEFTVDEMNRRGISQSGGIFFGQLLGMADQLTSTLAVHGYKAYKYVPYGPVKEVIPYLIRRAEENSDVLGGIGKERKMLWDEFLNRIKERSFK